MAFFTDLTRKIAVFRCKFYSPKILPVKKNDKYQVCAVVSFFMTNGNERNVIKFMVLGRMRLSDEANEAI